MPEPQAVAAPRSRPQAHHIFISTGEVSGDLQGALLAEALYRQAQARQVPICITGLGGDRMAQAGVSLLQQTTAIGSVGIVESIPYILPTLKLQGQVLRHLRDRPPQLAILIDYMGPNLGIGALLRRHFPQLPTAYYIAPQEWVWSLNQRNTSQIVRISDQILAIFPASAQYYAARGAKVTWVGHPLVDRLQAAPSRSQARAALGLTANQPVVTLIPASRSQELRHLLPVVAAAAQQIAHTCPETTFLVPLSRPEFQQPIATQLEQCGITAQFGDDSLRAIAAADVAITKSGTVNLELALLDVPQVVLYRVHPVTAWIAQHILKFSIPYMSPANLVTMTDVVPEFLQDQATPTAIAQAALTLLQQPDQHQAMRDRYAILRQQLGSPGVCDRAANHLLDQLIAAAPL